MDFTPPASRERVRVLLVEDHHVNQKVVRRMLERMGCVVDVAEDGEVGVARAATRPTLILMDCSMPRCDGFEATRRIRALPGDVAQTPIVALTAHATPADRDRCLAAGMDNWVPKPVSPNDLVRILRRYTFWTPPEPARLVEGVLDAEIVDQLLSLSADEPGFFASLVADFRAAAELALVDARAQFEAGQLGELRRTVHRLKSAGATMGALRLREACTRLESSDDQDLGAHGETWLDLSEHEVGLAVVALTAQPGGAP